MVLNLIMVLFIVYFANYAKYTINNTMIKFKTIMNTTLIKKGILYD